MSGRHQMRVRDVLRDREIERGPDTLVETLEHWRLARSDEAIFWLTLDRAGESANTLSEAVIRQLDTMIDRIGQSDARALVIRSAKSGGFAAGADIRDFRGETDAHAVETRMHGAHRVIDRLAGLKIPTIAVIHGHCLGGGLELALACRHRIALPDAKLGFPEVLLGLHPGLGGTFRLTGLIDPLEAMTMMLTGRSVYARKARRIGLVDEVVDERHVAAAVEAAALGKMKPPRRSVRARAFELPLVRRALAARMRKEAAKRAPPEHYPAPHRLIDLWEEHGGDARAMQAQEVRSFSELLAGESAQNLIRVYFLREGLRSLGKGESDVARVHVIGAGTMGREIALWCASRGMHVSIADLDAAALGKAVKEASRYYDRKLHARIEHRDAMDRLMPDFAGDGVAAADIVIEAIAEKAEVKRRLYADIAPRMKDGAILATNTSSIPLEALRDGLPHPERFVGVHFFNPVTRMELVEIVSHDQLDPEIVARARAFCGDIGRLPAPVESSPGFVVNRALTPYLVEAFLLLDEGVEKETIDRAAERFGMPMGPIELADNVGLDVGLEVARSLKEAFPDEIPEIPSWLVDKVEKGETGRKSGRGLYEYGDDGKPKKKEPGAVPGDMADRLVLPMLNVCARLLREGVVADADTLDAAMIFGTGFATFRGGPLHYARTRGIDDIVRSLEDLRARHGARFEPDEGWESLRAGKTVGDAAHS